jgi:hypothetical protein
MHQKISISRECMIYYLLRESSISHTQRKGDRQMVVPFVSNEDTADEPKLKKADYRRAKRAAKKEAKHKKSEAKRKKDESNRNKSLNRKQIRELRKNKHLVRDLLSIINSYFPDLLSSFKEAEDKRCQKYIKYCIDVILVVRILSAILSFDSQQAMTKGLNNDNVIKNIAAFLGKNDLTSLPHGDTINDCFKKMNPEELERFIQDMIIRLLRRNTFNTSRICGSEWQILVDATQFFHSHSRHCDHCLFSRHKNKKGEVTSIDYYHNVLEAKLVLFGTMVFSIQSEFIENEEPIASDDELWSLEYTEKSKDMVKQDCETKAFYRLAEKLKKAFPNLPICITTDALYPCKEMFEACQRLGWHYIMRFKEGVIPSLAKQFRTQTKKHPEQSFHELNDNNDCLAYSFVNDLTYEGFAINAVELTDSSVKYPFWFITDYHLSKYSCKRIAEFGRRRWKIENEGFKRQKKHGYHLTHMFSKDYTAMKVHYFLIQIAHAISQLWEHSIDMKGLRYSLKELHDDLMFAFKTLVLTAEDIIYAHTRKRIRLDHGLAA